MGVGKVLATDKEVLSTKSENTRLKLIDAGVCLFAQQGYEATSTRQVQEAAAVQRNLITYHFGSKEEFWKACMTTLFDRMTSEMATALEQAKDIEPRERIRFLVRRYVRASAAHPEIPRIMFDEGRADNWRLDWLVENYSQPFFQIVSGVYAQSKSNAIQLYYLLVSCASVFAMAPEYQRLSGVDPFGEEEIDKHANLMAELLTAKILIDGRGR
ncbi:MAG: TetR/AcrR family transcriptional regulator [Pseudomonadota bacterium]